MNIVKSLILLALVYTTHVIALETNAVPVVSSNKDIETEPLALECLKDKFEGETGTLKPHEIPIDFSGRYTIGDLNNDGNPDFVISRRTEMAAYDLCGNKLWQLNNINTNWDTFNHVYWHWSSYGIIGDADGDNRAEFLHIGSDWRTLYVRNGKTGEVERTVDLGAETHWMYVLLGRRAGEQGSKASRVFVTGNPGNSSIKAFDIRDLTAQEWFHSAKAMLNAYMPPMIADLDENGEDEIVHSTTALSANGQLLWRHNMGNRSVLGAAHTLQISDLDPQKPGLEATYSVYGPKPGKPSIMNVASSDPAVFNWGAYSPFTERHPHQHVVGDFSTINPGLEVVVRNGDGINHWMTNYQGEVLNKHIRLSADQFPPHWNSGEIVQGIEWDEQQGTEILYVERHVDFKELPALVVVSSSRPTYKQTPFFHGGFQVNKVDTDPSLVNRPSRDSWFAFVDRGAANHLHQNDGPYEGNAHAIDVMGDGREEVVAMADKKIMIYYNSGNANVPRRWGQSEYMLRKKLWCHVYNPR